MVGLTCKDSKALTSDSWKLPLSTAQLLFDTPLVLTEPLYITYAVKN